MPQLNMEYYIKVPCMYVYQRSKPNMRKYLLVGCSSADSIAPGNGKFLEDPHPGLFSIIKLINETKAADAHATLTADIGCE